MNCIYEMKKQRKQHLIYFCCRKTTVCNEDQLLDFSVPELVRSQSTFCTDPEVLQNCAGFSYESSSRRMFCRNGFDTMHFALLQIYCVLCVLDYYLLNSYLCKQDWVGLCFGNLCVC